MLCAPARCSSRSCARRAWRCMRVRTRGGGRSGSRSRCHAARPQATRLRAACTPAPREPLPAPGTALTRAQEQRTVASPARSPSRTPRQCVHGGRRRERCTTAAAAALRGAASGGTVAPARVQRAGGDARGSGVRAGPARRCNLGRVGVRFGLRGWWATYHVAPSVPCCVVLCLTVLCRAELCRAVLGRQVVDSMEAAIDHIHK
jgi:hypothetical protein